VTQSAKPAFSVSVRDLVEFVWRSGDLGGDGEFVASDRALAGIRGHHRIQKARPNGYQREVCISHEVSTEEAVLRIHGRIDGLLITADEVLLEEIKTIRGASDHTADPLHWAQAKVYGFIYLQNHALETITIQLTYLHLDTDEVTEFRQRFSRSELTSFFEETAAEYLEWVQERYRWCRERDASIRRLVFPFPSYRAGQRELAVSVYHTLAAGGRLFVEAPTGIGKTISVIFPALKALAEGKFDQMFYLTARTIGRTVAEKAFADLNAARGGVRTLTLTAKEKLCVRDGQPCDLRTCPMAIGYYDRRKPAMRDALNLNLITRPVLEAVSHKHQVCPFELSLDVSLWCDAVICDYNYAFDPGSYLRRHFAEPDRRYAFFVDEAHNLVDRAREMFSADLETNELDEVRHAMKEAAPRCAKRLAKLRKAIRMLAAPAVADVSQHCHGDVNRSNRRKEVADLFTRSKADQQPPYVGCYGVDAPLSSESPELRFEGPGGTISSGSLTNGDTHFTEHRDGVLASRTLPAHLLPMVEDCLKAAEEWLVQNQAANFREGLLQLYFRLHSFRRTAEGYGEDYVTLVNLGTSARVRLFCLDPSSRLRDACVRATAIVFFSATLTPLEYYRDLLGGEDKVRLLQLQSPFDPTNLAVVVHERIRTNLKAREETLAEVVEAIAALVQGRRGNYLVYFPSYQYLQTAKAQFEASYPKLSILVQRPGMTETEREQFLAAFASDHSETLVGFAVLGGIFGEGIDLVGERLIGAVIVGVGLPQLCAERDLIRDYFQVKLGSGFDYAYTFPGMNRVLQAAGRVIRSETDRGFVVLIDTRFAEARYRRLLPHWWRPLRVRNGRAIREAVALFYQLNSRNSPG
jgi:DNA excision repair protein ERCC-2